MPGTTFGGLAPAAPPGSAEMAALPTNPASSPTAASTMDKREPEPEQNVLIPKELPLPQLIPVNDSLPAIQQDIGDCTRCRLHEGRSRIVFGAGNPEARLVFVGEGPGEEEDKQGLPFVGRAGQLLTQMIEGTAKKEGIPVLRADVYICNVVKCRPPKNRTPEPDEMETCGQFLARQLLALAPRAICALGGTAARALLGKKEGVTRLRGNWFRWNEIPVMVTYHPSYLLRAYSQEAKREAWEDLKKVLHLAYD
ncbi:MAG: uracil-DNA glycosylase [Bryobacteraceae bacterium]